MSFQISLSLHLLSFVHFQLSLDTKYNHICKITWPFHFFLKVQDGFPLRLWKVTVEVPASPEEVLTRVLREQAHWDEDLLESRIVETLDEKTEVYQYVRNTMAPHPTKDHLVLR